MNDDILFMVHFPFTNEAAQQFTKSMLSIAANNKYIRYNQTAASVLRLAHDFGQQVVISNLPKVSGWIYLMMCILRHSSFSSFIHLLLCSLRRNDFITKHDELDHFFLSSYSFFLRFSSVEMFIFLLLV